MQYRKLGNHSGPRIETTLQPEPSDVSAASLRAVAHGRISRRELALYMGLLLAASAARVMLASGPHLSNDSYQYLSVVENLHQRGSLSTSIIYFDTERASGRVPAPATTFAPGYPLAIWALSWTRLRPELLALALSLASAIAVLPLLRAAASAVGLGVAGARACLLIWASSTQVAHYATSVLAETLFAAMTLAALVLLLRAEAAPAEGGRSRLLLAYFLVGLSCWVRYAGLLFVLAFHAEAALRIRQDRKRLALRLASLLLCDVMVGSLLARNHLLTGTWRGGNERALRNGFGYVLHRLGDAAFELTLGSIQRPIPIVFASFAALAIVGVLVAFGVGTLCWIRSSRTPARPSMRAAPLPLSLGVYFAGMCYLGLTTQISLGARMFVPVLPEVLLVAGLLWSQASASSQLSRAWKATALAPLAAGFFGGNVFSHVQPPRARPHRMVADAMALSTSTGVPLSTWIEASIPPNAVIFAAEGQATGYALKRMTVSAIGREYSAVSWDEREVRETMSRFGAEYLLIYPQVMVSGSADRLESEFLRLLGSRNPPRWLELVAENPRVLVYRSGATTSLLRSPLPR